MMEKNNTVNWLRVKWAVSFLIFGGLILAAYAYRSWQDWSVKVDALAWCIGWTDLGIAARLGITWNHHGDRDNEWDHYVLYFLLFAMTVGSTAAFSLGLIGAVDPYSSLKFYSISMTSGIGLGLNSERLHKLLPFEA